MGSQKEVRTFRSRWISEGSYRAHSLIPKPSTTPSAVVTVAENLTSPPSLGSRFHAATIKTKSRPHVGPSRFSSGDLRVNTHPSAMGEHMPLHTCACLDHACRVRLMSKALTCSPRCLPPPHLRCRSAPLVYRGRHCGSLHKGTLVV